MFLTENSVPCYRLNMAGQFFNEASGKLVLHTETIQQDVRDLYAVLTPGKAVTFVRSICAGTMRVLVGDRQVGHVFLAGGVK